MTAGQRPAPEVRDAVMETEDGFREDLLASWSIEDLLVQPINRLAARWRSSGGADADVEAGVRRDA